VEPGVNAACRQACRDAGTRGARGRRMQRARRHIRSAGSGADSGWASIRRFDASVRYPRADRGTRYMRFGPAVATSSGQPEA